MTFDLPKCLTVCGKEYEIRSDFRDVLNVLEIMGNLELREWERGLATLLFFYPDFQNMPPEHYEDAKKQCFWFINGGKHDEQMKGKPPRLMDWEQDFPYIIAPVNRVLGQESRQAEYLHWWTFLSAYMEIGECIYAQIVRIRDMRNRGKPLDKAEKEWYRRNQKIVDLRTKYTSAEEDILKQWGGSNTPPSG